jgi:hypothetical protein
MTYVAVPVDVKWIGTALMNIVLATGVRAPVPMIIRTIKLNL